MVPPKEMEKLVRYYKGELTENAWLNKAARTAAKRDLLLKSKLPAGVIKAKVKPLSRNSITSPRECDVAPWEVWEGNWKTRTRRKTIRWSPVPWNKSSKG